MSAQDVREEIRSKLTPAVFDPTVQTDDTAFSVFDADGDE